MLRLNGERESRFFGDANTFPEDRAGVVNNSRALKRGDSKKERTRQMG